jgi:hypothetical protein
MPKNRDKKISGEKLRGHVRGYSKKSLFLTEKLFYFPGNNAYLRENSRPKANRTTLFSRRLLNFAVNMVMR